MSSSIPRSMRSCRMNAAARSARAQEPSTRTFTIVCRSSCVGSLILSNSSCGPESMLKLDESKGPKEELSTWSTMPAVASHYFCPSCGLHLFWIGFGGSVGVNVRNFDGMKLEAISWTKVNGKDLKW